MKDSRYAVITARTVECLKCKGGGGERERGPRKN